MQIFERYRAVKAEHPGSLLIFRVGDFYEAFGDDALDLATVLRLSPVTHTNPKTGEKLLMVGFPQKFLDGNLAKICRAGLRVAVCEPVGRK